jgi:hypothetical protein
MGFLDGSHAQALREAQNLWDRGRNAEAIGVLEAIQPDLWPRIFPSDALIVATLARYVCESGDPARGLKILETAPFDERPRTDVQAICLGTRSCCRAAAGDISGAQSDRAALHRAQPGHPALVQADTAIGAAKRSLLSRATITRPVEGSSR